MNTSLRSIRIAKKMTIKTEKNELNTKGIMEHHYWKCGVSRKIYR